MEDGREIFDDDLDEESIQEAKKKKVSMAGPRKKKKEESTKRADIQSMIRSMPSKKTTDVNCEDDILAELIGEISGSKNTTNISKSGGNKNIFCRKVYSDFK